MGIFFAATPPLLFGRLLFGCDGFSATHTISDDALAYATERMHLEPLRTTLATTNKLLKRNKAFRRNQLSGLLALNLDANEHFKSRSRCCPQCLQRQITVKNAQGQEEEEVTEYYHK